MGAHRERGPARADRAATPRRDADADRRALSVRPHAALRDVSVARWPRGDRERGVAGQLRRQAARARVGTAVSTVALCDGARDGRGRRRGGAAVGREGGPRSPRRGHPRGVDLRVVRRRAVDPSPRRQQGRPRRVGAHRGAPLLPRDLGRLGGDGRAARAVPRRAPTGTDRHHAVAVRHRAAGDAQDRVGGRGLGLSSWPPSPTPAWSIRDTWRSRPRWRPPCSLSARCGSRPCALAEHSLPAPVDPYRIEPVPTVPPRPELRFTPCAS